LDISIKIMNGKIWNLGSLGSIGSFGSYGNILS
jgi:hypothetical protein